MQWTFWPSGCNRGIVFSRTRRRRERGTLKGGERTAKVGVFTGGDNQKKGEHELRLAGEGVRKETNYDNLYN